VKRKLTGAVAFGLLGVLLLGLTAYAAPPAGCWYTGLVKQYHYITCNWCLINLGNGGYPDADTIYSYRQYQCPDGSIGWELVTITNTCTYYASCMHQ